MRQLFIIPKDLWGPLPWHKARLDLQGFVKQNRQALNEHEVEYARGLYGPFEAADHHTPFWSSGSPVYIEHIYTFINESMTEIELYVQKIRELYAEGIADPSEVQHRMKADGFKNLSTSYINSVIRDIQRQQRIAA